MHRSWPFVFLVLAACRTQLLEVGAAPDSAQGTRSDGSFGTQVDLAVAVDAALPPCTLQATAPVVQVTKDAFSEAATPSMVALDSPSVPRVAIGSMRLGGSDHPSTVAASYRVDPTSTEWIVEEHAPITVGADSHTWVEMATLPGKVAFSWFDDPGEVGRLRLRFVDAQSFSLGTPIDLSNNASVAYALSGGAGIGPMGGHVGTGIGVVWREEPAGGSRNVVSVLDESGARRIGPHVVSGPFPESRPTSMTWTSSSYVLVTPFASCGTAEPLCHDHALVVTRVRPPLGPTDDSGIDEVATIPFSSPLATASRPSLSTLGAVTVLTWMESSKGGGPPLVRAVRLAPDGTPIGTPTLVATGGGTASSVAAVVSSFGMVVVWREDGAPSMTPELPGASRLRVVHLDDTLEPRGGPLTIDISKFYVWGGHPIVAFDNPRSAVLTWAGKAAMERDVLFAARLDCVTP